MREQMNSLLEGGILKKPLPLDSFFTNEFLPDELRDWQRVGTTPTIALANERHSPDDLMVRGPIRGFEPYQYLYKPYQYLYIGYEDLLELPAETFVTDIVWLGQDRQVTALDLETPRESLGIEKLTDFVLADCRDGYHGNFDAKVLTENKPFLVLKIDGFPPHGEGRGMGNNLYYLNIKNENGLLDPDHKKPYGVASLEFTSRQFKLEELYRGALADLSPQAARGREIYLDSCLSCHRPLSGHFGGTLSNRNLEAIAVQAKYNRQYFLDWVRDPQGQIEGVKMGPHPYPEETLNQLIAFLEKIPGP